MELEATSQSGPDQQGRWAGRVLAVYAAALLLAGAWCLLTDTPWTLAGLESGQGSGPARWLERLGLLALRDLLLFFPLGFLVAGALPGARHTSRVSRLLSRMTVAWLVSTAAATAARIALNGPPLRPLTLHALVFVAGCCLWGSWCGATWFHARSWRFWLAGQVLFLALGVAAAALLVRLSVESKPLAIAVAPLQTDDRRRLVRLFRDHDPRRVAPGRVAQVRLSQSDLNQLLAWGLSLGASPTQARLEIEPDAATLLLSMRVPAAMPGSHYLNIRLSGNVYASRGLLGIQPRGLQVGRLRVPQWLLALTGPAIVDRAWQSRHTRPFLSSLRDIELADRQVLITYGHLQLSAGFVRDALVDLGGMPDMAPATVPYVRRLVELGESTRTRLPLEQCVAAVFDEARQRSVGGDPVRENSAALLALGYLLGEARLKTFIGPELPTPPTGAGLRLRWTTLRRRVDLSRHFALSAALEVVANATTSSAVGLLKEELDADGGSGFSFVDLQADRAGIMLARRATSDPEQARNIQQRLAGSASVDDFFPTTIGLPEGLTDAEFRRRFGGVGGPGYQQLIDEIDRRIASCPLYQAQDRP